MGTSAAAAVVNTHEAKTHLSRLLERVAQGETIIIAKAGTPLAELRPFEKPVIKFGLSKGKFGTPEEYDRAFTEEADAEIPWNLDEPIDPDAR